MKKFSTISSLFIIGALGILASSLLSSSEVQLDLSDEDIHMYL